MNDRRTARVLPPRELPGRRDALTAVFLALLGIAVRLAFVRAFPAAPKSDSEMLVAFGRLFHDRGFFPNTTFWIHFNPGLPMILSLFDGLFSRDIAGAARTATAVAMGFLGVLPFLLWRPVLEFRWRLLAGLLLTLWPGQVFLSGIVTQDNWVLLPSIALCALAARGLRDETDTGHPAVATLLFVAAFAIRQEMLVVLAPPWLAAAAGRPGSRRRVLTNLGLASALAGIGVLALATQRYVSTGRFTIATEHGGARSSRQRRPGLVFERLDKPARLHLRRRALSLRQSGSVPQGRLPARVGGGQATPPVPCDPRHRAGAPTGPGLGCEQPGLEREFAGASGGAEGPGRELP